MSAAHDGVSVALGGCPQLRLGVHGSGQTLGVNPLPERPSPDGVSPQEATHLPGPHCSTHQCPGSTKDTERRQVSPQMLPTEPPGSGGGITELPQFPHPVPQGSKRSGESEENPTRAEVPAEGLSGGVGREEESTD